MAASAAARAEREALLSEGKKKCSRCGEGKPLEDFLEVARLFAGRGLYCQSCRALKTAESTARNGGRRWYHLKSRYNLTRERFEAMVAEQGGCCAACSRPTSDWHVDHDHACCPGQRSCGACVRGLLCQGCNHGLGHFYDDPERLRSAAAYLERTTRPAPIAGLPSDW